MNLLNLIKTTSKILCILWTQKICRSIERCDGKTKLKDAVRTGVGKSKGKELICCMDFAFIGGSMGAVVGEKIARELITQLKQLAFCDDFKIRWR
jgi:acetyl-CoA carboxylase carboxyl transferase subunit beta